VDLTSSLEVAGTSHIGVTVMRVILDIYVANWAGVTDSILFGTVVGRAADVGTTPLLGSMPGLDWFHRGILFPSHSGAALNVSEEYKFDIRSKRKCGEQDQRVLLCFDNTSPASKTINFFARTLWALP
jgi:hypothetical protein